MNNIEIFGKNLRAARKRRNLSIAELAKLVGVNYWTIFRYEAAGRRANSQKDRPLKSPSLDIAVRLAIVLDISLDKLCELDNMGK